MSMEKTGIDFVVTWVDGEDPAWLKQKSEYSPNGDADARPERYRDWGLMRYWFRGVEKFAPWVRTVHFVTWGHLPAWLDLDNPKLHIVRHEDYMPQGTLPTFNCNALEVNLHRIPGLSSQFVYFNDDVMLIDYTRPTDFFVDGKPRDMLALQSVVANPENPVMSHMLLNNSLVICKYFDKRTAMRRHPGQFFKLGYPLMYFVYNLLETVFPLYTGFYTVHGPSPFLKSTFEEVWEKEGTLLLETSSHKFRSRDDVTQYLFREWEKQKGNFVPANLLRDFRYLDLSQLTDRSMDVIREQKVKMVCVNDTSKPIDFEKTRAGLQAAFEHILPEKSSFEVD